MRQLHVANVTNVAIWVIQWKSDSANVVIDPQQLHLAVLQQDPSPVVERDVFCEIDAVP